LYEAIQTVIERWGGHLVRDNFLISVRQEIGTDNGIIVQYKKNLKDIVCQENWDNVVTKILPTGQDGIMLNALDQSADVYITSETQYAIPYTKTVSFEQDINQEDYPTEQAYQQALVDDLRAQATAYLDANCIPQVSYTLKANLDRVTDIGDTVEVIDERLGVNLMTHVIGFDYDCISQKYTEVEFGSFSQTLSGFASQMTSNTQKIVSQAVGNVSDEVMGILTKSYVIYDGASILIVDTLPKENAQNVIKIDNSGVGFSQTGIQGQFTSKWDIDGSITLSQDVTIDGKPLTDFITASGTDDGWDWVEYKSGNIEAHTQIEVESADVTWSTLITGLNKGEIPLTMLSTIDNPIVTAEIESCGTDVGWVAMADETKITMIRTGNTGTIKLNIAVRGTKASPQSP
jgi:phage-related protein